MTLVAVCGIPGSGKSTVCLRLQALGLDAWETDHDISGWRDAITKKPVAAPDDWHDPDSTVGIEYAVRRDRIEALRARADAASHVVYVCGPAGGEEEYWDLFDLMISLTVDNETLGRRLRERTTNTYGKAPHEREMILTANLAFPESYQARGAVLVDATQPMDDVVDAILALAAHHHEHQLSTPPR
jgi:hypothetical protein